MKKNIALCLIGIFMLFVAISIDSTQGNRKAIAAKLGIALLGGMAFRNGISTIIRRRRFAKTS